LLMPLAPLWHFFGSWVTHGLQDDSLGLVVTHLAVSATTKTPWSMDMESSHTFSNEADEGRRLNPLLSQYLPETGRGKTPDDECECEWRLQTSASVFQVPGSRLHVCHLSSQGLN
jgi:hypothetical protein